MDRKKIWPPHNFREQTLPLKIFPFIQQEGRGISTAVCKNFGSISFVIKNWPSRLNFFQCYEVNFRIKTQVYRLLILSGFKWLLNTCGDFQKLQNFSCKKMGMLHIKWKFFIFIKSEKNDFWRSLFYSLSIELLWSHKKKHFDL